MEQTCEWNEMLDKLRGAAGKGGSEALIRNATELLQRFSSHPHAHLDMALGGNAPTFRQVAARALATVPAAT